MTPERFAATLLGHNRWWRITPGISSTLYNTYWHWDGTNSWYTSANIGWRLEKSNFDPDDMDHGGPTYQRVKDPRP